MAKNIVETDRGWVDLSNLVYSGKMVNWPKSIGKTVDFKYDDITATLTITERDDDVQYVYIDVPGYVQHHRIYVGQIRHGQLGRVVSVISHEFKYNVGDIVNGLLITGRYRAGRGYKYYNYNCVKDGYESSIREDHLAKNHGCPVCANRAVLKGYNDIATVRPDMAELFCDKDEPFVYSPYSNKFTYFICPRCGNKIYALINSVALRGLACKKCSDGISYPNKFMFGLMEQISALHLKQGKQFQFEPEKKFEWSMNYHHENKSLSGKKIYDMYIPEYNIIIEAHGDYHYKDAFSSIRNARSFEEVVENDDIKRTLAISNGIQETHYIVLDCSKSNMEHIKNSVMTSNLPELLGFTEDDISWEECNKFATSSRVYEACTHWNNGIKNYKELASIMTMSRDTIRKYIKRGKELGIIQT